MLFISFPAPRVWLWFVQTVLSTLLRPNVTWFLKRSIRTKFPSPGVEPGPCGRNPQILTARPTVMLLMRISSASSLIVVCADDIESFVTVKYNVVSKKQSEQNFPLRESNPGLVGESHKSYSLDQLGCYLYHFQRLVFGCGLCRRY